MSSISSQNEFSHRQGSIMSIPDEDDQTATISDPSSTQQRLSSTNEHAQVPDLDAFNAEKEYQIASIDLQTVPDMINDEHLNQNWEQLSKEISTDNQPYLDISQSDSTTEITASFGFTQQQRETSPKEVDFMTDYETIVRSEKLYFDPNPELIRKPQMITPLVYKQNIRIKFLKPPPVPQGPLIIREVRPPQPPPPPPLVIRQRPPPPLSPPPLILREKPPQAPAVITTQVLTKTLPPIPPPPRSVIVEKLPPLPPKPRDIIIERWIPYESTTRNRKVIVQRAAEAKPYPPPRNVIIIYEKVEAKIIRQFERYGVTPEDPENYSVRYGNALLDTKDLLAKARELGITEDLSLPNIIDQELQEQLATNSFEQTFSSENLFQQKRSPNGSYISDQVVYPDIDNNSYDPTYENLINASSSSSSSSMNYQHLIDSENNGEDLSAQLALYGLTTESIPY